MSRLVFIFHRVGVIFKFFHPFLCFSLPAKHIFIKYLPNILSASYFYPTQNAIMKYFVKALALLCHHIMFASFLVFPIKYCLPLKNEKITISELFL